MFNCQIIIFILFFFRTYNKSTDISICVNMATTATPLAWKKSMAGITNRMLKMPAAPRILVR